MQPVESLVNYTLGAKNVNRAAKGQSIVSTKSVSEALAHLMERHDAAKRASEHYADDIKAVAKTSGVTPGVLRRYVAARCSDKYTQKREESEQLELLFSEVA